VERETARQAALRRMLVASQGSFSLSFAVCDDRTLRDDLIQRLCTDFPGITRVDLAPNTPDVYQTVRERLPSSQPAAIFVLDLEASVPFEAETYPTLRVLNSSRELWEQLACPVVFWLAAYAAALIARKAPDFWRYRSHQFEFVPDRVTVGEFLAEPFSGFEMADALPFEEKRFRIAELEKRLQEVGAKPSSELLPHVLTWIYELAHLYRHSNQCEQARELLERAVQLTESTYGSVDPRTATAINNLATLLQATNHLAEAEPLMARVVSIFEKSLGENHPNVAAALNNLARLLQATNRLAEAEPLMRRALAIDERSFGPEHPNVAIRLNNLATLLQDTNCLPEAEPLMRRALAIGEQSYGPDHPNVATALNNLAGLLQATNRLGEAEPLMRRVLEIFFRFTATTGHEHPNLLAAIDNYAGLLEQMGHSPPEIQARLSELARPFGIKLENRERLSR
jgi:tetratricopeptide (TPR) repeat protein